MQVDQHKCEHEACTCTVGSKETYCSDACAASAQSAEHPGTCDCGHPGCGASAAQTSGSAASTNRSAHAAHR